MSRISKKKKNLHTESRLLIFFTPLKEKSFDESNKETNMKLLHYVHMFIHFEFWFKTETMFYNLRVYMLVSMQKNERMIELQFGFAYAIMLILQFCSENRF